MCTNAFVHVCVYIYILYTCTWNLYHCRINKIFPVGVGNNHIL